jgi:hypothetical protein
LEKIPGYCGISSAISDLVAVISNIFTKADTQKAFTSGGYRPKAMGWTPPHLIGIDVPN